MIKMTYNSSKLWQVQPITIFLIWGGQQYMRISVMKVVDFFIVAVNSIDLCIKINILKGFFDNLNKRLIESCQTLGP